jgi:RNA polymerase sigma factor (sigma-70 family)
LSQRQRAIIGLRYLVGLPTAEIAERMGLAEGTVRVHLSRGLRRLRLNLEANT